MRLQPQKGMYKAEISFSDSNSHETYITLIDIPINDDESSKKDSSMFKFIYDTEYEMIYVYMKISVRDAWINHIDKEYYNAMSILIIESSTNKRVMDVTLYNSIGKIFDFEVDDLLRCDINFSSDILHKSSKNMYWEPYIEKEDN